MSSLRAVLRETAARLGAAGIEAPRLEARLLVAHALGIAPEALLATPETTAPPAGLDALVRRRLMREPLAFILGRREFWSLDFAVSGATLVPRPDSETLIEAAVAAFKDRASPDAILDLGTGTGCLLLAALHEFPRARGVGVDIAPAAAALARGNAARLGLADRSAFTCGRWATALDGRFDLILCNPPYIASSQIGALMPEVSRYEPASALDGGADGCDAFRAILPDLPRILTADGIAVLELGDGQAEAVGALADRAGLTTYVRTDLAGTPRAMVLSTALPQKNRLARREGKSSFDPMATDGRFAAGPWRPLRVSARPNVEGLKPGRGMHPGARTRTARAPLHPDGWLQQRGATASE